MTFREQYLALEEEFRQQVEKEESSFVHNIEPRGPVDFVLVAMEPSLGVRQKKDEYPEYSSEIERNFTWSTEDFILHFCIREYLCKGQQTYHLTDLSKGGMATRDAGKDRTKRYERWYPLLKKELQLVAKPGETRIIAIGNVVRDFLTDKHLCESLKTILHYAPTAAGHRNRKIQPWKESFPKFREEFDGSALEESVEEVLKEAKMELYIDHRLKVPGSKSKLTPSRMMLIFYYKNRFEELRTADHIILKFKDS